MAGGLEKPGFDLPRTCCPKLFQNCSLFPGLACVPAARFHRRDWCLRLLGLPSFANKLSLLHASLLTTNTAKVDFTRDKHTEQEICLTEEILLPMGVILGRSAVGVGWGTKG